MTPITPHPSSTAVRFFYVCEANEDPVTMTTTLTSFSSQRGCTRVLGAMLEEEEEEEMEAAVSQLMLSLVRPLQLSIPPQSLGRDDVTQNNNKPRAAAAAHFLVLSSRDTLLPEQRASTYAQTENKTTLPAADVCTTAIHTNPRAQRGRPVGRSEGFRRTHTPIMRAFVCTVTYVSFIPRRPVIILLRGCSHRLKQL